MRAPLSVVGLVVALALSACAMPGQGGGVPGQGGGVPVRARAVLAEETAREGWQDVVVLIEERTADMTFVLAAYMADVEFDRAQGPVPAECWWQYLSRSKPDGDTGTGGGSAACFEVESVVDPGNWGFGSEDIFRITGHVAKGVREVDVVFKDGSTERLGVLSPGAAYTRDVVSARLSRPADQVSELRPVEPS